MSKKKKGVLLCICILSLLIGLFCIMYPAFASWYNERHKAQVQTDFNEIVNTTSDDKINAVKEAAITYNKKLYEGKLSYLTPEENGYYDQLDIAKIGIMGYIRIPIIDVNLPIYHGVGDKAISTGTGHIPQTSLPIGGENTHAALSAHTGMASDPLFSELERMKIGNFFYIDVLGETHTYQVDNIQIVEPDAVGCVKIEKGKDLVTLITCTPYGVNSHRLLVRGTRVENSDLTPDNPSEDIPQQGDEKSESVFKQQYMIGILRGLIVGLGLVGIFAIIKVSICLRKKKAKTDEPSPNRLRKRREQNEKSDSFTDGIADAAVNGWL